MNDTYLMPVIRTTEKVGSGRPDDIAHQHVKYHKIDGELLFEKCDGDYCEVVDNAV